MPPQPGMFPVTYASVQKQRANAGIDVQNGVVEMNMPYHSSAIAGSARPLVHASEDSRRDRRRRDMGGKLGKDVTERRDDVRHITDSISNLHNAALQMATQPHSSAAYLFRLYPLSLERSALLAQLASQEEYAHGNVRIAWEEERDRVEEEWRRGRDRVRERLLEGIEERRRRAREEKDGEGITDATLDSQSRPHITRKLRNKLGNSPPPTPFKPGQVPIPLSATMVPVPNPNSLSVDELPSPFPLPLTSSSLPNGYGTGSGQRRKAKGGVVQPQALTGLGKAISQLTPGKELEIETDLGEIRRGTKRKRTAATTVTGLRT